MELLGSEKVLEGQTLDVSVKRYRRADGTEVSRQVVEHPGSVAILAYDDAVVYLVRQPREAVEEDGLLEIPAGTLDQPGESPLECARRELAEEAGLAAAHWRELKVVHPSPGFLSETVTVFAATGLTEASAELNPDEQIEVVRLPRAEAEAALAKITDATTVIALLILLRE